MRHFSLLLVASMMAICAQAQVKHFLLNDSIPVTEQKADTLATDTLSKKNDQKKNERPLHRTPHRG